ncbi:MAG: YjbH domain-containing protein, partial [Pseudomonadota bacterium]
MGVYRVVTTVVFVTAVLGLPGRNLAEEPVNAEPLRPSHNFYGMTGLIDMPSAEMQPDGQISATTAFFGGFSRNTISAQILPGVEAAFRYSVLDDFLASGDLFDRSFDVKIRFLQEGDLWPSVAVGLQDFLGTGIYSGEYVAATKGFFDGTLKVTGGVGWGRFA